MNLIYVYLFRQNHLIFTNVKTIIFYAYIILHFKIFNYN